MKRFLSTIEYYLNHYPAKLKRDPDSVNYRFLKPISDIIKDINIEKTKVSYGEDIERPLLLWREQNSYEYYNLNAVVRLDQIKQVKIYTVTEISSKIIYDSGILKENIKNHYISLKIKNKPNTIIPEDKWVLHVTTYYDTEFMKGFPENIDIEHDVFDKDIVLDKIGNWASIPRMVLIPLPLEELDYHKTYPPFCMDKLEWDYTYYRRLKEIMRYHGFLYNTPNKKTYKLPQIEVNRAYAIPIDKIGIHGRWRELGRMGDETEKHKPYFRMYNEIECPRHKDAKYMLSPNWNPSTFNVTFSWEDIPNNSPFKKSDVENLLRTAFPITKKGFLLISDLLNEYECIFCNTDVTYPKINVNSLNIDSYNTDYFKFQTVKLNNCSSSYIEDDYDIYIPNRSMFLDGNRIYPENVSFIKPQYFYDEKGNMTLYLTKSNSFISTTGELAIILTHKERINTDFTYVDTSVELKFLSFKQEDTYHIQDDYDIYTKHDSMFLNGDKIYPHGMSWIKHNYYYDEKGNQVLYLPRSESFISESGEITVDYKSKIMK